MKPTVAYPLLTATFLLFFVFSQRPHSGFPRHRSPRRLIPHAEFDPLMAEILERKESVWNVPGDDGDSGSPVGLDQEEAEDFAEQALNVTRRLVYLFPLLDNNPQDNEISEEELRVWNMVQAKAKLHRKTWREMKARDVNGDGRITLREYLRQSDEHEMDLSNKKHGQAGWWNERFIRADLDNDRGLNVTEFNDFLHPEDSKNIELHLWLLREKIRELDGNHDGRLSYVEFRDQAYEMYKNNIETEFDEDDYKDPREKFDELDADNDGFLSEEELKPMMDDMYPGEHSYANYYTKYLMHETDVDYNGKLSLEEMLDHPYAFYGSVYQETSSEDDDLHDEF